MKKQVLINDNFVRKIRRIYFCAKEYLVLVTPCPLCLCVYID